MTQTIPDPGRRRMLNRTAALALGLAARDTRSQTRMQTIARRAIPSSSEMLPMIGLGTYQVFDVDANAQDLAPLEDVMRAFVAHGASVVDSSPMYGNAETIAGELSARLDLRKQLFLATKVWTTGKDAGIAQMEQSFRRMRTDRMDLMQVHNLQDWRTHLETLEAWKAKGRVRYLGITHYHSGAYAELERLLRMRVWDFVQLNFSLAERDAQDRLLPLAAELGVAVIVNRPFAQGSLFSRVRGKPLPEWAGQFDCTSWAQYFLKWIVSHPAVTCVIPASRKKEHTEDNLRAGLGRLPDAATRQRMAEWFDGL
ncbi:MAG: aldo/keto reductase [Betaproteobacteria bacterium]|nr:aldo/keto reductase [Betaproteobacteria bacterium]